MAWIVDVEYVKTGKKSDFCSAYMANRPVIRQAEASVFPSFFQPAEKLIIFLFEFSLPGT